MLAVPPAILDLLNLQAGATIALAVDGGRLVMEAQRRPRHTLDSLLGQCDGTAERSAEDGSWLDGTPVGTELL